MSDRPELLDHIECEPPQLNQSLGYRLNSPPAKIPERYTRNGATVALEVTCSLGGLKFRMFPLINFQDSLHGARQGNGTCNNTQDKLSVLIEDVEVVDDVQGIVERVGGIIRLKSFDEGPDVRVCDSFYFSFKESNVIPIGWPRFKYRELNLPNVFYGRGPSRRKMPDDVVETGSQLVVNLANQHPKSWWDEQVLVVLNGLRKNLAMTLPSECVSLNGPGFED